MMKYHTFYITNDYLQQRLTEFNQLLLSSSSATAVLRKWYQRYHPQQHNAIYVHLAQKSSVTAPHYVQRILRAKQEMIHYRQVTLYCHGVVLSKANNWYRPDCLTTEMNQRLMHSHDPFGEVVASHLCYRDTLLSQILWQPDSNPQASLPDWLMTHQAVLCTPNNQPFSFVQETYGIGILDGILNERFRGIAIKAP